MNVGKKKDEGKDPKKVALGSLNPMDAFYFPDQADSLEEALTEENGSKIYLALKKEGDKVEIISVDGKLQAKRDADRLVVPLEAKLEVSEKV